MLHQKRSVVGVTIEVRRHGNAERGRGAGSKSCLLRNVIFLILFTLLATESVVLSNA